MHRLLGGGALEAAIGDTTLHVAHDGHGAERCEDEEEGTVRVTTSS